MGYWRYTLNQTELDLAACFEHIHNTKCTELGGGQVGGRPAACLESCGGGR